MADGPETKSELRETGTRESPRLTPEQFLDAPEFRRFKRGMKKLLKISKGELDRRLKTTARIKATKASPLK
jgi:hypothetical protein